MNLHPYIGLTGTVRVWPYSGDGGGKNDYHGVVVAVCQGGSTTEEGGSAFCAVSVLRDVPDSTGNVHGECDMYRFIPDDIAEARRRLEGAK
jgi:hypothetical protein